MIYGLNLGDCNDDKYFFDRRLGVIHVGDNLLYENNKYLRLVVSTKSGLDKYLIDDIISINPFEPTFYYEGRFNFYEKIGITERTFVVGLCEILGETVHDYIIVDKTTNYNYVNLHLYIELYDDYKIDQHMYARISKIIVSKQKRTINFEIYTVISGTFKKVINLIEQTIQTNPPNKVNPCREQLKVPRLIDTDHYLYEILSKSALKN
jgi:hypothetical protein